MITEQGCPEIYKRRVLTHRKKQRYCDLPAMSIRQFIIESVADKVVEDSCD
jgi:hypothetical protein